MHAGHWISRSRLNTRFRETNVHAQCVGCNSFRNGMPEEYRRAIVRLYGEEEMESIFRDSNEIVKMKVDDYDILIEKYKEKYRELNASTT